MNYAIITPLHINMPGPTDKELNDPIFNAIWQTIKSWDINAPEYYSGYCGANGSHAVLIYRQIREVILTERLSGL